MFLDSQSITALVQSIGWALVHFLWQGAIVGALYAAGVSVLRDAHPSVRYRFGLGCMLVLAMAPVLTAWATYKVDTPVLEMPVLQAVPAARTTPLISPEAQQQALNWSQWFEGALPYIVMTWGLGVLLMSTRVLLNIRRMRRMTRVGVRPLPAKWDAPIARLMEVFEIERMVRVVESTLVEVPTVLGYFKPVVLLPTSSLIGLTPRQLELVIAHELGHIRRLDYVVNLLQVAVETVLFYHPVVGWISRHVREEREKCCDDLVISRCGKPIEYAKALANLESFRSGDFSPALAATDGQLFQRIERIVHNHKAEPREAIAGNTAVLVLAALTVVAAGRLSDPLRSLEERRAQLADTLVAELMMAAIPAQSDALLAPLENARFAFAEMVEEANERANSAAATDLPVTRSVDDAVAAQTATEDQQIASLSTLTLADGSPALPTDSPALEFTIEAPTASAFEASIDEAEFATPDIPVPALALATPPKSTVSVAQQAAPVKAEAPAPVAAPLNPWAEYVLEQVAPEYPVRARISGQTGFVELSFELDFEGRPKEIAIETSHPRRVFESAALRALKKWRFDPNSALVIDGQRINQRFDFNLQGVGVGDASESERVCRPLTGTRICRTESPTVLMVKEANP